MSSRHDRATVTVVGSINRDLSIDVPTLPTPGQTISGGDLTERIGGKGANQAVAAARLGATVRFVGRLGTDGTGLRDILAAEGVSTDAIVVDPTTTSGVAVILVAADGENVIALSPGGNGRVRPEDLPADLVPAPGDVVLLQQEIPAETVLAAAVQARRDGGRVILNPAPYRPLAPGLLEHVDVLVPNAGELADLVGAAEPTTIEDGTALLEAADLPCPVVVLTLGSHGALVREHGTVTHVPAPTVTAIDTVGAGDTLCGALADALSRGVPVLEAVRWAAHAAALAVTGIGAQDPMPGAAAVRELIAAQGTPA